MCTGVGVGGGLGQGPWEGPACPASAAWDPAGTVVPFCWVWAGLGRVGESEQSLSEARE